MISSLPGKKNRFNTVFLPHFQGWAAAGSTSRGGKPFFLGRLDPAEHCIFFDDHISPLDPKIVEPWMATVTKLPAGNPAQLQGIQPIQFDPKLLIFRIQWMLICGLGALAVLSCLEFTWFKRNRSYRSVTGCMEDMMRYAEI